MKIPKRIVLSRKGFDTTRGGGGGCSPVFDGRPFSIPIPQSDGEGRYLTGGTTYGSLSLPPDVAKWTDVENVGDLLKLLGRRNVSSNHAVHLDPDIRPEIRPLNFVSRKAIFGQDGASLTELTSNSVSEGTLFLFFGLFQPVEKRSSGSLRFAGKRQHIIWGWMQVGKMFSIQEGIVVPDWVAHHPHITYRHLMKQKNALYIATDKPTLSGIASFGEFSGSSNSRVLSIPCNQCRCDYWNLPSEVMDGAMNRHGNPLPCHANHDLPDGYSGRNYTGQGQEFVFDTSKNEAAFSIWLSAILAPNSLGTAI
jgi:hypothetical protein